jgi:hypothetical protein
MEEGGFLRRTLRKHRAKLMKLSADTGFKQMCGELVTLLCMLTSDMNRMSEFTAAAALSAPHLVAGEGVRKSAEEALRTAAQVFHDGLSAALRVQNKSSEEDEGVPRLTAAWLRNAALQLVRHWSALFMNFTDAMRAQASESSSCHYFLRGILCSTLGDLRELWLRSAPEPEVDALFAGLATETKHLARDVVDRSLAGRTTLLAGLEAVLRANGLAPPSRHHPFAVGTLPPPPPLPSFAPGDRRTWWPVALAGQLATARTRASRRRAPALHPPAE